MKPGQVWLNKDGADSAEILKVDRLVSFRLVDPDTSEPYSEFIHQWPKNLFEDHFEQPRPTRWDRLSGFQPEFEFFDSVEDGDT